MPTLFRKNVVKISILEKNDNKHRQRRAKVSQIDKIMEKMLAEYEKRLLSANNEMQKLPEGRLSCVMREGKPTFFQVITVDGKRIRKSINRDKKRIQGLARKKYLEEEATMLKSNIRAARVFLDDYEDVSADNILGKLPKEIRSKCLAVNNEQTWANQPYTQSQYKPENKIHTTTRGLKVRSKSELLIAEKLYEHDVQFRYEQLLHISGMDFAPDFTIRTEDGSLIYWEHCGLTNNKTYMEKHKWKLSVYEKAGIVPWENLIVTYDDKNGILNLSTVESEILNKIKV